MSKAAPSTRQREQKTGAFKERYKIWSGIESTNAELKSRHGAGSLRVRGKARVAMSMQMKGTALNVKRATTWRASRARSVVDETPTVHASRPPPDAVAPDVPEPAVYRPPPPTVLTRDVVEQVTVWLGERYAEGTVYQTLHPVLREFWPWASDRDVVGLEAAPRDTGSLMPRNAVYTPPSVLLTLAEVDAMIARITVPRARVAAVLMRGTGLRIEQVAHVRGDDFDVEAGTMLVRKGKSRREKALMRTVAVPEWLVPTLEGLGAMRDGFLIRHQDRYGGVYEQVMPSPRNLAVHFKRAWERAEKEEVVRAGIWKPGNRKKASTTHALRAVYQATLEEAGVRDGVIDWLVGHSGRSTRATRHTKPSLEQMRAAVAHIPAIEPA